MGRYNPESVAWSFGLFKLCMSVVCKASLVPTRALVAQWYCQIMIQRFARAERSPDTLCLRHPRGEPNSKQRSLPVASSDAVEIVAADSGGELSSTSSC